MISPDQRMKACKGAHQDPEGVLQDSLRVHRVGMGMISTMVPGGESMVDAGWQRLAKAEVRSAVPVPPPTLSAEFGQYGRSHGMRFLPAMPVMRTDGRIEGKGEGLAVSEERRKANLLIEALTGVDPSFGEKWGVSSFTFVMWRSRAVMAILKEFRDWDEKPAGW